ncbi:hypothetical protein K493DRAFT_310297 [Basidiobolus meristosporus CBS 931.73]|uniref:PurM-like C-terminal domain-containing protein n=1 Tax=Basidiobolus meristosporus CBS 931.73 TaxID=1314790 RepID=A0A1Y1ZBR5_9FUNG|nr:hypothetical protein K493DRAFT_310297 [Basidiobolus meristosporus CBS 931.73]|eukprot:ORY07215.1 hypothetical protein K493DRAFT_310297 [Basidiobolus meristosporus CBS 931.73]
MDGVAGKSDTSDLEAQTHNAGLSKSSYSNINGGPASESPTPFRRCSGDALLDTLLEHLPEEKQDNLIELYTLFKCNKIDPQQFLSEARKICPQKSDVKPIKPIAGDVIVLTKPLGTQVVMMAREYLFNQSHREKLGINLGQEEVVQLVSTVTLSMVRTDHVASELLHKHGTHGVVKVSQLGILGQAKQMLTSLDARVSAEFHTLPMFKGVYAIEKMLNLGLFSGYLGEASGGWMIMIPEYKAEQYIHDIKEAEGWPAFIIGRIVEGNNDAYFADELEIIEVEHIVVDSGKIP